MAVRVGVGLDGIREDTQFTLVVGVQELDRRAPRIVEAGLFALKDIRNRGIGKRRIADTPCRTAAALWREFAEEQVERVDGWALRRC